MLIGIPIGWNRCMLVYIVSFIPSRRKLLLLEESLLVLWIMDEEVDDIYPLNVGSSEALCKSKFRST